MKHLFTLTGALLCCVLALPSFGQTDTLKTKPVVVYFIDGTVDSLNVIGATVPQTSTGIYSFAIRNRALNSQLSEEQRQFYLSRNQTVSFSGKKIHSINFDGQIKEVSGSIDPALNIALCLERHRLQRRTGVQMGIFGGLLAGAGPLIGFENGGSMISLLGAATVLAGSIVVLDATKWFSKERTVPKVR